MKSGGKIKKYSETLSVIDEPISNRTFLVGASFLVKTYFVLEKLPLIHDCDAYIATKSPHEQYSTFKTKNKEMRMMTF